MTDIIIIIQSPLESGKNPTRAFISMTMEKHLKTKVPGSGWRRKRGVISSCNTTHGTILVSTIIGWVPNNPAIVESRTLDSWAPITFSGDFLFLWFLLARRALGKKDKDRRELVCASAANFLDTNQASINPYLHWCGYLIRHPLERKKKKKTRRAPFWNFLLSRPVVSPVKRFVRLGALNCVRARAYSSASSF
jgi:hypothetical protein